VGGIHIVSFRNLATLFRPLGAEASTRRYGTFGLSDEWHYATFILGRRASTIIARLCRFHFFHSVFL
jgi:hypothetical protein